MSPDYAVATTDVGLGDRRSTLPVKMGEADAERGGVMRGIMRILLVGIIGVAAVLAVLVTVLVVAEDPSDPAITLTPDDDQRIISLVAGDEFDVALPGNPSTGYTWVAVTNEAVVRQVGDIDFTANNDLIGAAGTMVMHFECVAAGTTELSLDYLRPFEPNEPPIDMFAVQVSVTN